MNKAGTLSRRKSHKLSAAEYARLCQQWLGLLFESFKEFSMSAPRHPSLQAFEQLLVSAQLPQRTAAETKQLYQDRGLTLIERQSGW